MRVNRSYTLVTKKFLEEQYIDNHLPTKEIAEKIGCGYGTAFRLMKSFNIQMRALGEQQKGKKCNFYKNGKTKITYCKCGKQLSDFRHNLCHECYHNFCKDENHGNWKGGLSRLPYSIRWNNELKEKIRDRDNCECQICNKTQKENLEETNHKLNVHHIDYNKQNCSEGNLISLCSSCHMKTHYNRENWKMYFKNLILKLNLNCLIGKRGY